MSPAKTNTPALPWTHNLADGEAFKVRVFRDHPGWDRHEKWWMMPVALLEELFVASYLVETPGELRWLEREYGEGYVFVY